MVSSMTLPAGGGQQPYSFLYGLIVAGSALNPPRRALPFIAAENTTIDLAELQNR